MNDPWRISLLGGLRIQEGQTIITRFNSQKTAGLLAYLAYYLRNMQPREVLIDIFWPQGTPETGRASLSTALSTLRNQLEPLGIPAGGVIRADRYAVGLNPVAVTTDVAEFEALLLAAARVSTTTERAQLLVQALDLYQGCLLPGFYDVWIPTEQERLSGRFFDASNQLLTHLTEIGDISTALGYARKAVSIDPLHEETNRNLMSLLVSAGQPGSALWQFKELERRMEEETGDEPSAQLRRFVRQIETESGLRQIIVAAPVRSSLLHPSHQLRNNAGQPPLSGTPTFLMTEVEGSARLSPQKGDTFNQTVERHLELFQNEFAKSGGQVIKAGVSCLVAFASARRAVHCAIACQEALSSEVWPEVSGDLTVRMALDTGDVEQTDGGYHGLALQQVSRMLTAGNDRQILLSEATAALVRRHLDEDALHLVDLGVYQLRDVPGLQRLFQADYPGMNSDTFQPIAAVAGHNTQLPIRYNRFFGREQEISALREMLIAPGVQLVTITGPGGTGKTRLSLEVAERLMEVFEGAITFVPLADVIDARLIPDAILSALHVPRSPSREPLAQVLNALNRHPSLLILDNLEHLIATGATAQIQTLISRIERLKVLVTSRQTLRLSAEREFVLAPLSIPKRDDTVANLTVYESVQLFIDRAQIVKPDFRVTSKNAPAVSELVNQLEGIPLAIEMAAARVQILTPAQMLVQLQTRFEFLTSRKRDTNDRHQTLHATVDWSYRLLSPELQHFFCRLSVFRGGWSIDAAESVCEEPLALDLMAQLRECSLALSEEGESGMRFRMLETLRDFGRGNLSAEELSKLEWDHTHFFLGLAEELGHPIDKSRKNRLDDDYENLRTALSWCQQRSAEAEAGLRFGNALWMYWDVRGSWKEGLEHIEHMLHMADACSPGLRALSLTNAGYLAWKRGDWNRARRYKGAALPLAIEAGVEKQIAWCLLGLGRYEEALAIYEKVGDIVGVCAVHGELAAKAKARSDYPTAQAHVQACLKNPAIEYRWEGLVTEIEEGKYEDARALLLNNRAVAHRTGHRPNEVDVSIYLGDIELCIGELATARTLFEEGLAYHRDHDNLYYISYCLRGLSEIALRDGQLEESHDLCLEGLSYAMKSEHTWEITRSVWLEGQIALGRKEPTDASAAFGRCLVLARDMGNRLLVARGLEGMAEALCAAKQAPRAVRLLAAATTLRTVIGGPLRPIDEPQLTVLVAALREDLGADAFSVEWELGRVMTWEQAVAYALAEGTR